MVNLWDEFSTLREFGQFFLGLQLEGEDFVKIFSAKEFSTSGVFLMVHFLAFIEGPGQKSDLSNSYTCEGFCLQNFTCCQDLIFGIREESEKSHKVNLHPVDIC